MTKKTAPKKTDVGALYKSEIKSYREDFPRRVLALIRSAERAFYLMDESIARDGRIPSWCEFEAIDRITTSIKFLCAEQGALNRLHEKATKRPGC